jgi:hypothetical protein
MNSKTAKALRRAARQVAGGQYETEHVRTNEGAVRVMPSRTRGVYQKMKSELKILKKQ